MTTSAVEIQFQLHASRPPKRDSPERTVVSRPGILPRITRALAMAIQFEEMIALGEARHYADLARLGCITRERISQIMELLWLAPDIQQEILELPATTTGRFPLSEAALRRVAANLDWVQQHVSWDKLKQISHIG